MFEVMTVITYLKGDIFSSPAQVLVNTVNTVGVMGKGVALEFKKRYPEMFKSYERVCDKKQLEVGKLMLWKGAEKWVLMFPTKKHWRNPSKMEYIEAGLKKFTDTYIEKGITSIAFPRLGCGNGGLDWEEVRPLMERYLKRLSIPVYIYVGTYQDEQPEHMAPEPMDQWLHSNPENIGFTVLKEDLARQFSNEKTLLTDDGTWKTALWDGEGIRIKNGKETYITARELCEFWAYIRESGIISSGRLPETFAVESDLLLKILQQLGYLQPVMVSADDVDFESGYQYIRA